MLDLLNVVALSSVWANWAGSLLLAWSVCLLRTYRGTTVPL